MFFFFDNPKISVGLTQFIDFTVKQTMLSKMNAVNKIKNQGEYHPAKDHWKQLRDRIKLCYEKNLPIDSLDSLLLEVHEKKVDSYSQAIKSFKKFVRNKDTQWFTPPKAIWKSDGELVVRATAEVGLYIDGKPYLIKLFFKGATEKITERNIKPILTLMSEASYEKPYPPDTAFCVFNTKTGKLHIGTQIDPELSKALRYEIKIFEDIWND
ncbi:hypothetical protein [Bacillus ndiopicus]|uniref:hypothetical protein n=1 Tax=Bacillus ndiopicus TaxID=1347368 RepID=UPI0005A61DAA|nr:hypothetical protein [Bacillus ndiopicus]